MKKISKRAVLVVFALAIAALTGCKTQNTGSAALITTDTAATYQFEQGWLFGPGAGMR
jgi:curli biogenesis system outer membrane secretion channel CsgG